MKRFLFAAALGVLGCGGSSSGAGDPASTPEAHEIYADMPGTTGAGSATAIGPFTVPAATVGYTLTERTSSSVPDSWDVGVATQTEVGYLNAGQQWQAYALSSDATGSVSSSSSLPAGTYFLVVNCRNLLEDCVYSFAVQATY